jgi:hypothetical protein
LISFDCFQNVDLVFLYIPTGLRLSGARLKVVAVGGLPVPVQLASTMTHMTHNDAETLEAAFPNYCLVKKVRHGATCVMV